MIDGADRDKVRRITITITITITRGWGTISLYG